MALSAGDVGCTSGLAKAIYDARVALKSTIGLSDNAAAVAAAKADSYAVASAIVDYLVINTEVVISLTTAGLQTSTTAGTPTAAPAPPEKTLPIR